jgi:hypothetical protein
MRRNRTASRGPRAHSTTEAPGPPTRTGPLLHALTQLHPRPNRAAQVGPDPAGASPPRLAFQHRISGLTQAPSAPKPNCSVGPDPTGATGTSPATAPAPARNPGPHSGATHTQTRPLSWPEPTDATSTSPTTARVPTPHPRPHTGATHTQTRPLSWPEPTDATSTNPATAPAPARSPGPHPHPTGPNAAADPRDPHQTWVETSHDFGISEIVRGLEVPLSNSPTLKPPESVHAGGSRTESSRRSPERAGSRH